MTEYARIQRPTGKYHTLLPSGAGNAAGYVQSACGGTVFYLPDQTVTERRPDSSDHCKLCLRCSVAMRLGRLIDEEEA